MGSKATEEKVVGFNGKLLYLAAVDSLEAALGFLERKNAAVLIDSYNKQTTVLVVGPEITAEALELLGLGEENRLSCEVSAQLLSSGPIAALAGGQCFSVPSKNADLFYQLSGIRVG